VTKRRTGGTTRPREAGAAWAWVPLRPAPPPLRDAPAVRPLRPPRQDAERVWREIQVGIRRYRRLIGAALVTVALALVVSKLAPKPAATTAIVVAARDLPAGEVLTAADLRTVDMPAATLPSGVATDVGAVVGSQLSGPLRRHEPLTDVRLNDGLLRPPAPGLVSAPVRLADSQAAVLLRPGQRIDVLAASTAVPGDVGAAGGSAPAVGPAPDGVAADGVAAVVAANVMVVAIPVAAAPPGTVSDASGDVGVEGTLVVLATTPMQARQLAQAQVSSRLSAVVVG
jgi:pilus assembly protein CpaB